MSRLFYIALASELMTPMLILNAGVPSEVRWVSHSAIFCMILISLSKIYNDKIINDIRINNSIFIIIIVSIIGILVALINGQDILAILWGWWLIFRGPFIGIYSYYYSNWSKDYIKKLYMICIGIIVCELILQLLQYARGEEPGDNMAGSLGNNGTEHLVIIIFFTIALLLGEYILKKNILKLIIVLALGMMSSILGEMKIYYFAIPIMVIISIFLYYKNMKAIIWAVIPILVTIIGVIWVFPEAYNKIFPYKFENILNKERILKYVNNNYGIMEGGFSNLGRMYGLQYVWESISINPIKIILGEGVGARSESKSFKTIGIGVLRGDFKYTGTSLVVILGEYGIFGLIILLIMAIKLLSTLYKKAITYNTEQFTSFIYGIIIFTLLTPLWMWYAAVWQMPIPSLLFWTSLGYIFPKQRNMSYELER